jgi:hypothetical protein
MMKTSKTKAINKPNQTSEAGKEIKSKKVTAGPSKEEIRLKAKEIYHERIARGEHGTAEDDWLKAEHLLKG